MGSMQALIHNYLFNVGLITTWLTGVKTEVFVFPLKINLKYKSDIMLFKAILIDVPV